MFSFILIATLITLLALAILIIPLRKPINSSSYHRDEQNIHFARERLRELEQQLKNNSISDKDYQSLKTEIETSLALDIDLSEKHPLDSEPNVQKHNRLLIALLCLLIPIGGLTLYLLKGTPEGLSAQASKLATNVNGVTQVPDIKTMMLSLEKKLEENPDDIQGWTMLGRSYQVMGQFKKALDANRKVIELGGGNADIYAAMADASAFLSNGVLTGQANEYIQKALKLNDNHPQALWLAGLSFAQMGDTNSAREYWNKLLPLLAGAPEQQKELQSIIDQSIDFSAKQKSSGSKAITNTKPATLKSDSTGEQNNKPNLQLQVTIDDSLVDQINDNDIVFVIAKAKQGPPAPLAVKKFKVSELPNTVTLSDADAMIEQFRISRFDDLVVTARISKSGQPIAQSGDFESSQIDTRSSNTNLIKLNISQTVD